MSILTVVLCNQSSYPAHIAQVICYLSLVHLACHILSYRQPDEGRCSPFRRVMCPLPGVEQSAALSPVRKLVPARSPGSHAHLRRLVARLSHSFSVHVASHRRAATHLELRRAPACRLASTSSRMHRPAAARERIDNFVFRGHGQSTGCGLLTTGQTCAGVSGQGKANFAHDAEAPLAGLRGVRQLMRVGQMQAHLHSVRLRRHRGCSGDPERNSQRKQGRQRSSVCAYWMRTASRPPDAGGGDHRCLMHQLGTRLVRGG